jgi:hypothetical protein
MSQGFGVLAELFWGGYFERRRDLIWARTEAKSAPAPPTTARMAVGFSGEFSQPLLCARRGRVTKRSRAKPSSGRVDFFIEVLQLGKYCPVREL